MNDLAATADPASLRALYGEPMPSALIKEMHFLTEQYATLVRASPFIVISTAGADGLDCSPRGDPPGFVRVVDGKTLIIPDRSGNNRIDSLNNIAFDGRIAVLFLIPGVAETMRVNGRARISTDPGLLQSFADPNGKTPRTAIVITVERAYAHCAQCIVRSKLWDPSAQVDRKSLPSFGEMLKACRAEVDSVAYDREYSADVAKPED